ncbi:hypothetical protein DL89DRAFT_257084 [Linderina pennispora]|uniref:Uncharacterized protein n=1 Tax=Linderina pennispora TaxID=61395 RepID=A0A1Y1WBJ7_9FUNG|nr:uncharacterized protein DL89DRAFT_257084 [Linderina pennispora]ORX70911.1 hypothetical protein DL89DRAFT_257084 [Linderina pennispora]
MSEEAVATGASRRRAPPPPPPPPPGTKARSTIKRASRHASQPVGSDSAASAPTQSTGETALSDSPKAADEAAKETTEPAVPQTSASGDLASSGSAGDCVVPELAASAGEGGNADSKVPVLARTTHRGRRVDSSSPLALELSVRETLDYDFQYRVGSQLDFSYKVTGEVVLQVHSSIPPLELAPVRLCVQRAGECAWRMVPVRAAEPVRGDDRQRHGVQVPGDGLRTGAHAGDAGGIPQGLHMHADVVRPDAVLRAAGRGAVCGRRAGGAGAFGEFPGPGDQPGVAADGHLVYREEQPVVEAGRHCRAGGAAERRRVDEEHADAGDQGPGRGAGGAGAGCVPVRGDAVGDCGPGAERPQGQRGGGCAGDELDDAELGLREQTPAAEPGRRRRLVRGMTDSSSAWSSGDEAEEPERAPRAAD